MTELKKAPGTQLKPKAAAILHRQNASLPRPHRDQMNRTVGLSWLCRSIRTGSASVFCSDETIVGANRQPVRRDFNSDQLEPAIQTRPPTIMKELKRTVAGTDGRPWDLFRGTLAGVVAELFGVAAGFVSSLYLVRSS